MLRRCKFFRLIRYFLSIWSLLSLLPFSPVPVQAATVELPLYLRTQVLQNALEQSLNVQPDGRAVLFRSDPYNYFHISEPRLDFNRDISHFTCKVAAGAGFKPLGIIPAAIEWRGAIDLDLLIYVDRNWQLRYRIIGATIYEEDGSRATVTNFILNLSKDYLYPVLEDFSFDLSVPRQEILDLIRSCVTPEETGVTEDILHSLSIGILRPDTGGIMVPLQLTIPDQPVLQDEVQKEQKPLSAEELEAFQKVFEPLDAFLVTVIKTAGRDFIDHRQREQLFELLINSRYQLLSILSGKVPVDREDPLRRLFIDSWRQLKAIIEGGEEQGGYMQDQLLRYMTFINAGDALLILDAAAPQLGIHITTNGLRRLARMINPGMRKDPLHYDWQVDPELRELFNFIPVHTDSVPSLGSWLIELLIGTAHADELSSRISEDVLKRLNRWVPKSGELGRYTPLIAQLLQEAALQQLKEHRLDKRYAVLYGNLVPATALIESCWRQYTIKEDKIWFIRSSSGSVGLMQINPHVWRGFYNIQGLRWDVVYNIQAGTQILMRYFTDYGLEVAEQNGKPAYAVRAAYSAYNAGPRAARRFLKRDASTREKQVDDRLWEYYRAIEAGGKINLAACTVD